MVNFSVEEGQTIILENRISPDSGQVTRLTAKRLSKTNREAELMLEGNSVRTNTWKIGEDINITVGKQNVVIAITAIRHVGSASAKCSFLVKNGRLTHVGLHQSTQNKADEEDIVTPIHLPGHPTKAVWFLLDGVTAGTIIEVWDHPINPNSGICFEVVDMNHIGPFAGRTVKLKRCAKGTGGIYKPGEYMLLTIPSTSGANNTIVKINLISITPGIGGKPNKCTLQIGEATSCSVITGRASIQLIP